MSSSARILASETKGSKFHILLDFAKYMGSAKDLDTLIAHIAEEVPKALSSERCTIFLLDEDKQQIWSKVVIGESEEIRFPNGSGIAGRVIKTGAHIIVEDAYSDKRFNKGVDVKTGFVTRNILCVPLHNLSGKTIGCFQVLNKTNNLRFDDEDLDFLGAFASQAAISIESVQLFMQREKAIASLEATQSKLQDKIQQLEVLYDVERASALLGDDAEFMQLAIEKAVSGIGAHAGSILLRDEKDSCLRFSFTVGDESERLSNTHIGMNEGIAGMVLQTGNSIIENNIIENTNHCTKVQDFLGIKTETMIVAPLYVQDPNGATPKIVGVAEILNSLGKAFTKDDLKFLESICGKITSMMARRKMLESKAHSDRLATIGSLTDTIIHDFKNPLTVIKAMAEIMGAHELDRPVTERYCKTIAAQIDRCVTMTREILDFSKRQREYSKTITKGHDLIEQVAELLEFECKQKNTKFVVSNDLKSDLHIDVDRIKRVIFNLTNNAFEAMTDSPVLTLSATENDENVYIRISDNGPGVPEIFQSKLFEAFATQGKKHGTGLGLHIASEIVTNHKGTLKYETSYTEGASFVIELKAHCAKKQIPIKNYR